MSQEQVGTRLPSDQAQNLRQYCEEQDISKAEALRRSVRELTQDGDRAGDRDQDRAVQFWRAAMVAGILLLALVEASVLTGLSAVLGAVLVIALLGAWVLLRTGMMSP